jgi:hypothetical protein
MGPSIGMGEMGILITIAMCLGTTLIGLLIVGGSGAIVWFVFKSVRPDSGLLKSGTPAQATIMQVWQTGTYMNNNPQLGFQLEVRPPGGMPYQAQAKAIIPMVNIPQFQPGGVVNVKVSPGDPSKVALDIYG